MTSAVTNDFRHLLIDLLKSDIDNGASQYYIGLARAQSFDVPADITSLHFQSHVRHTLQSVKTMSNASFVIPTVTWQSGTIYNAYDDNDFDQTNFYVVNSSRELFLCVEKPVNASGIDVASTIEPTSTLANNTAKTFSTTDGYKWRFLYKISNLAYVNYRTRSYTPVKKVLTSDSIVEESQQYNLQNTSVAGEIIGLAIDSAGTGYDSSSSLAITISGNGSNASFTASIFNGSIVSVTVDSDGNGIYSHGSGYDYASATVASGDAVLRPILGPKEGTAADPVKTLKSKAIMLQTSFQDNETDTILAQNDFSQVVLLRNLHKYGSDSDFTSNTGNALKSVNITLTSGSSFDEDETITNTLSTASAKVFYHDTVNEVLYYYQTTETGFTSFNSGQTIQGDNSSTAATIDSLVDPDVDPYSGEILYINNITSVDRADNQTEDIRTVIQLG